jgi:hypothetical protein
MCFIQLLDETFNPEIEDTMNEEIHENVDFPLEVDNDLEMRPQLIYVAYGIQISHDENLRKKN